MITYKGTDKDMKCRDFQFKLGEIFETEKAETCKVGFHGCKYPLDVFKYYAPADSRFFECEQSGEISGHNDDSKIASTKIRFNAEIGIPGLVKAAIEYVSKNAKPSKKHHTTGNRSANSATGYGSANISTGVACSNNGAGERNISVAWGKNGKCKGAIGSFLVLSEWDEWDGEKYPFRSAVMVEVDGEKIKANTWYRLEKGEIVEVANA